MTLGSARSDNEISRYGLAVSKRVGGSVTRNKVKRRLRECFSSLEILPGYDIVVSARPAAAQADYHMLLSSLRRLAGRAGVLQPEDTAPVNNSQEGTVNQSALEKE
jgi:ribonuclease P protein component